jgi:TPR repeat protein
MFTSGGERALSIFRKFSLIAMLCLAPAAVMASAIQGADFQKAIQYFESKQYAKALPLLEELAKSGNKAAMYRLAYIYENGLGVPKDFKKAAHWYKEAAKTYAYTIEAQKKGTDVYSKKLPNASRRSLPRRASARRGWRPSPKSTPTLLKPNRSSTTWPTGASSA